MNKLNQLTLLIVLSIALTFSANPLHAQTKAEVSADSMSLKDGVYYLEGSVVLKRDNLTIRAERATYDEKSQLVHGEGGMVIENKRMIIKAPSGSIGLAGNTGELNSPEVYIINTDFNMKAEKLLMLGENHFILKRATVTTCTGIPAAWCISGSKVDVTLGESVTVTHATFRIKGIPVGYTPYTWIPIIQERRTGLLPPKVGYRDTTGGFISQPFFWAISPSRDATLTLDMHTREAYGQGLEYRYVEAPHINGTFKVYHLRDVEQGYDYLEWKARHRNDGRVLRASIDLNLINRESYYHIYEPYLEDSSKRYLESRGEVYIVKPAKSNFGNSRIYLTARHYQDLKEGVDRDTVLQLEPKVGLFIAPAKAGPFVVSVSGNASNFRRTDGYEGDRSMALGMLSHTMGDVFVLAQKAGVKHRMYSIKNTILNSVVSDDFTDTTSSYSATFSFTAHKAYGATRHFLEPSISYEFINPSGKTPELFDSEEFINDKSVATLRLTNRLWGSDGQFLNLRLGQPYDLSESSEPIMPFEFDLAVGRPKDTITAAFALTYNHNTSHMETANSYMLMKFSRINLSAGQSYNKEEDIETYIAGVGYKLSDAFGVNAGMRYDATEEEGLEETSLGMSYKSQCWGTKLTYINKPDSYAVYAEFTLLGIGQMDMN